MGKGIVVRVLEGTKLTPEIVSGLNTLLPGYKLESFPEQPNYRQSIERRIDSLCNAFLFLLEAYPLAPDPSFIWLSKQTMHAYVNAARSNCALNKNTLDELQKELKQFTTQLVQMINIAWKSPDSSTMDESVACLNEAEQYVLMMEGRPDTATLTPLDFGAGSEYVLQLDENIPPYYTQWLDELRLIKSHGFPKTPSWFRDLDIAQQAYLNHANSTVPNVLMAELDAFLQVWSTINGSALDLSADLKQVYSQTPPLPVWFDALSPALQEMIKLLAKSVQNITDSTTALRNFLAITSASRPGFGEELEHISALPQWYWVLVQRQQCFLEHALNKTECIEDVVSFLSSRHRTLPAPANFAAHRLFRISATGEAEPLSTKRYRSSHIASRDSLAFPAAVQERHCKSNLERVIADRHFGQKILWQTLISPIPETDYIPTQMAAYLPELPPDLALFKLGRAAAAQHECTSDIWQHNHPFNIAKFYHYTASNNPDSLAFISAVEERIKVMEEQASELAAPKPQIVKELLRAYRNTLLSALGSATLYDYNGRELFLSSLEQLLIIFLEGHSYGSCVSGKDRKAVELLHTDAMLLYKKIYGEWPLLGDAAEKRARFVALAADLYLSRHQQQLAGQNAPGAEGIKTPEGYLPKDICTEIKNRRLGLNGLQDDDRLASNNEVKAIFSQKMLYSPNQLLAYLIASELGEEQCTRLYDALNPLVNEKKPFHRSTSQLSIPFFPMGKDIPTGIQSIRTLMHDQDSGPNNVIRFARIMGIVLDRPLEDCSRTQTTRAVYDGIRGLCSFPRTAMVNATLLVEQWRTCFENSKRENQQHAAGLSPT